jgi:hypothetical protein
MLKLSEIQPVPDPARRETDAGDPQLRAQAKATPVPRPAPRRSLNEAAHKLH